MRRHHQPRAQASKSREERARSSADRPKGGDAGDYPTPQPTTPPAHPAPPTLLQQEKPAAGLGPGGLQENAEPRGPAQGKLISHIPNPTRPDLLINLEGRPYMCPGTPEMRTRLTDEISPSSQNASDREADREWHSCIPLSPVQTPLPLDRLALPTHTSPGTGEALTPGGPLAAWPEGGTSQSLPYPSGFIGKRVDRRSRFKQDPNPVICGPNRNLPAQVGP